MTTANSGEPSRRAIGVVGAIGEAVLGVNGVAFLRPALGDILRTAVTARTGTRPPDTSPHSTAGIRITTDTQGKGPAVEVHVVLLRGHRAVDVTRAIRRSVRASHPSTRMIPVHVTVTGII